MLVLQLDLADVAAVRFAVSPAHELVSSLMLLRRPERQAPHAAWVSATEARLARVPDGERRLLHGLVSSRGAPDFLGPWPATRSADIADELAAVAATPPDVVVADVRRAYAGEPLPEALARVEEDPAAWLADVVAALRRYWSLCVEQHWPAMRSALDADVARRTATLAAGGLAVLFDELHPHVRWQAGVLRVAVRDLDYRVAVAGRSLPLVPSLFANGPMAYIDERLPPIVVYPAHGAGNVWEGPPAPPAGLARLIGGGRARVLAALDRPRTTTELARELSVAASGVSRHLSVLTDAGLVQRRRHRRDVLYATTRLGRALRDGSPAAATADRPVRARTAHRSPDGGQARLSSRDAGGRMSDRR